MAVRRRKRRKDASSRESRAVRAMGAFVILCLVFGAGFLLRGNDSFLEHMGLGAYAVDVEQNPGMTIAGSTYESIAARVAEVQGLLEQNSLDAYDLDAVTRAVVADLLKQTGDPYARYYDEQSYLSYRENEQAGGFGVGVLFGDYQNQSYAVDLISGSSAQAAGVQVGDFVVAIDGERRDEGWPTADAVAAIEREEDATVVVTWRRPESLESTGGDEFTTTLRCSNVTQQNVTSEMLSNNVGYIRIRQLGRTTASAVSDAIKELEGQDAEAFVLDLRNCPGGYLSQAVEVASLFQDGGNVVQIHTNADVPTTKKTTSSPITNAPLAVIVNGNTAAAAEVLAASLQESNRATIVGKTTMGKGTVQMLQELSFGGAISYTVAEYRTPGGRTIDGVGVTPTIVADAETVEDGQDLQLRLAREAAGAAARTNG